MRINFILDHIFSKYDTIVYLNLSDMSTSYGKQTTSEIIMSGRRDLNGDGIDINA